MKRRDFLRILGSLTGSAFLSSCGEKESSRKLVSYVMPPSDGVIPGIPYYYPSTCTECPAGCGLQVKVRERWPIKLEGAKGHPVNEGGLCIRGQSSLSRLYHPDRIKSPLLKGKSGKFEAVSWQRALSVFVAAVKNSKEKGLKNAYLPGRQTGSLASLAKAFCKKTGFLQLPQYEAYPHAAVREAYRILFGMGDVPHYRVEDADLLITLGADILETYISPVSFAKNISQARERGGLTWYHLEPHFSMTGANAHKRVVIRPMKEVYFLAYLLRSLSGRAGIQRDLLESLTGPFHTLTTEKVSKETGISGSVLTEIRQVLIHSKKPLVLAGGVSTGHILGIEVALLCGLIQWMSGAVGPLVDFSEGENYTSVGSMRDMDAFSLSMSKNEVGVLIVSGTDPSESLPSRIPFRKNLRNTPFKVGFADLLNGTARELDLLLPLSHPIESWGDGEPRKSVWTLMKPVISPLYDTRSEGDILLSLMKEVTGGEETVRYMDYLAGEWKRRFGAQGTKIFLEKGYVTLPVEKKKVTLDLEGTRTFMKDISMEGGVGTSSLVAIPSLRTFDGRSGDLPLLSEIPDPVTTISYGRWVSVPVGMAKKLSLKDADEVTLSSEGWSHTLPVKVQPGLSENMVSVFRDMLKDPPMGVEERSGEPLFYIEEIKITRKGSRARIPVLSGSFSQQGRGIIPEPLHQEEQYTHEKDNIYPEHHHNAYRWAMAIDLDLCTGCSACVAACYIENNVPITGRKEHLKGREMSWLRIEPYYGEEGNVDFVPMLCQQCHYAPCEPVCPVYATYHNPEGLNVQVYNRCVGTRYCSNNCPYKVRRFNWFSHPRKKPLDRMINPDILVRTHGVMEKCTFCIQRIRVAKDGAKDQSRKVKDGEVATACGQSCPTGAITFGNILDKESRIFRLSRDPRVYRIYEGLGTEPSVYYLRKREHGRG